MDDKNNNGVFFKKNLSEHVCDYIFDLISTQNLQAGIEVPSEIQLIETLNVSRGVVREALRSLATLGVLDISSGKRPKVQVFNPSALEMIFRFSIASQQISLKQILEIRQALEVGSIKLAANNGTAEDFAVIKREMAAMRESFGNTKEFIRHDVLFHVALANASHNPLYCLMLKALRAPLESSMAAGLDAHRSLNHEQQILDLHQRIADRVSTRDAKGAIKAMNDHFSSAVHALIDSTSAHAS